MQDTMIIKTSAIAELAKLTSEINNRVESLELMSNEEFMKSFKKSKEQIEKRDFANWDAI